MSKEDWGPRRGDPVSKEDWNYRKAWLEVLGEQRQLCIGLSLKL